MQGIIVKAISGFYYTFAQNKIIECKARGNFRKAEISPAVGDRVMISETDNGKGIVDEILPRRNILSRPFIANIDKLFIISSQNTPSPDPLMIDRLSAYAVYMNIEPVIVFNKCDLGGFGDLPLIYEKSGFKTFVVSAQTGEGLTEMRRELKDCVCAFSGNSGVGKSSLLNALFENFSLQTGEVSRKLGRGKHTTRQTELFINPDGGFIADTPGFSSVELNNENYDFKIALPNCFPEFKEYLDFCRFTSCSHTCEKGCAVLEALNNGNIMKSRHESYVALYNELKDVTSWTESKKKTR